MKVLIIGGTIFLGRHLVAAGLARGHDVTVFHRGRHADALPSAIERLQGDRHGDVTALRGRQWDAVIDTCGYVPGAVRRVMDALDRDRVGHYTFVSSISVYSSFTATGVDERAPVAAISPEQVEAAEAVSTGERATARSYGEMYGALKGRCEAAAEQAMPGRVLNVRPGLIVGAYDYSDRFTYWVRRVAAGGDVLAPGRPERRVRVIDATDLAEWVVRMAESRHAGVFNATGAEDGLNMGKMLETCRSIGQSDARFVWVDEQFLLDRDVSPWSELPLWLPAESNGIFEVRNDAAIAAGLTFRPLSSSVKSILQWDKGRSSDEPLCAGLSRDRERELLRDAPHPSH